MAFNKDSTIGTLAVVTGLCLVCSIVVSVAAVGLRPAQLENKALDKQSNILSVAGVDVSSVAKRDLAQLYGDKIEARLVKDQGSVLVLEKDPSTMLQGE